MMVAFCESITPSPTSLQAQNGFNQTSVDYFGFFWECILSGIKQYSCNIPSASELEIKFCLSLLAFVVSSILKILTS